MSSMPVTRRSAVALLGLAGFSLPALLHGQSSAQQPAAQQPAAQQTHMKEALEALRTAKKHLDLAEADKGGHRAKAIELVNNAITEAQAAIDYAATHH
ncbi:MAG TPA: hypothetical protein VKO86_13540 [Gemmatimonadales bacterium]|nr:hypothetical protein [Gemmatimonadales bacterium]